MSDTSRSDHMAWCKQRALAYLPDDPESAITSMLSDLGKHEATRDHAAIRLTMMLMIGGHLSSADQVRQHIEGFN